MRFLSAVVTFASCINATPLIGQTLIQVPPVKVHTLKSKHVGDAFEIRVLLPPMISGEQTRFPVLYMTDVNGEFSTAGIMRLMMMADVPRFIAVGIGYPGAPDLMQAFAMRTRDLTPVVATEVPGSARMPIAGLLKPTIATGGGPRFLEFIRDELIPFIDARYPTNPKDRGYWGDSLGGLFGCYVLFTKPDTFNRYIIGSPTVSWADENVMKLAEGYVNSRDDLAATVFLGVGGLEEEGPDAARYRTVTNVLRVEKLLRAKKLPGLQLTTHVFPDETHITVAYMNLIRGLVAVYGRPALGDTLMDRYKAAMLKQSDRGQYQRPPLNYRHCGTDSIRRDYLRIRPETTRFRAEVELNMECSSNPGVTPLEPGTADTTSEALT